MEPVMEGESITPAPAPVAPAGNAPLNQEQGRNAIANLLAGNRSRDTAPVEKREEADTDPTPSWAKADEAETPVAAGDVDRDEPGATEPDEKPRVRLSDGTEVDLAEVEEWRKGTLRQSDYTRKTQELAAQRKEFETRSAEIAQKSQEVQQQIDFAITVARQYLPSPPDPEMLNSDPIGYLQQKEYYEAKAYELQQLYATREQHMQQQTQQRLQTFEQMKAKEGEALLSAMPQLKDKTKLEAFQKDILEALPHYGFAADDLKSVYDHRLVRIIGDAVAYRKLMSQKAKVTAKVAEAPPVAPVQPAGKRTSPAETQARQHKDLRTELRRTGDRHVATKLISKMLGP
jgi:hypothetical protein